MKNDAIHSKCTMRTNCYRIWIAFAFSIASLLCVSTARAEFRPPKASEIAEVQKDVSAQVLCMSASRCLIDQKTFERYQTRHLWLSQFVKLLPSDKPPFGLQLISLFPVEILSGLLLRHGDLFLSINGFDFTNPLSALQGIAMIVFSTRYDVVVLRGKNRISLRYELLDLARYKQEHQIRLDR